MTHTHPFRDNKRRGIHIFGLALALLGSALLVTLAIIAGGGTRAGAIIVYALCLLAMLTISAVYNLATIAAMQRRLRRIDHAVIFLMFAGSYTPFTT